MAKKNTPVVVEEIVENVVETSEPKIDATDMGALLARIKLLEEQLTNAKKANRGENTRVTQVINVLKERQPISIKGIASVLDTTTRNVSSVLTAIKNQGYVVHTDNLGQKYIVEEPKAQSAEDTK